MNTHSLSFAQEGKGVWKCDQPYPGVLTYETIKFIIEQCKIQSIDELLPRLPEKFRSNYTLMYKSDSLQEASGLNPRVIMFGQDAKFIIAFNGDPKQKGYNKLETIQFNSGSNSFEFRELEFASFSEDKKRSVHFSEKNPESCLSCHRSDARPNWEAVHFWPGAYGGVYDKMWKGTKEDADFQRFIKERRNQGRYKYLIGSDTLSSSFDKYDNTSNVPKDIIYRLDFGVASEILERGRPNNNFTTVIFFLNFKRMARKVIQTPQHEKYKYALLAITAGCITDQMTLESFFPEDHRKLHFPRSFDEIQKETQKSVDEQFKRKLKRVTYEDTEGYAYDIKSLNFDSQFEWRRTAAYSYLAQNFNIDFENFSTAFDKKSYTFAVASPEFYHLYIPALLHAEPDLRKELEISDAEVSALKTDLLEDIYTPGNKTVYNKFRGNTFCEKMRKKSVAAFSLEEGESDPASHKNRKSEDQVFCPPDGNTQPLSKPTESRIKLISSKTMLKTCTECHSSDSKEIPQIPFDNPEKFKISLKEKGRFDTREHTLRDEILYRLRTDSEDRMPPGSTLEERKKLLETMEDYLQEILK